MRRRLSFLGASFAMGVALMLSACAEPINPIESRDSFKEVTEDPASLEVVSEYDATAHPEPLVEPQECSRYLVITARGTGEPSRGQLLSPVVRSITKAASDQAKLDLAASDQATLDSATSIDLDYPADTDVKAGSTRGARVLIDTLNVQSQACPDQRFILLGYSQGAMVIGDSLAAPETRMVGETVGVVDPHAAERILAVVLYGNPRFLGGEDYSEGSFDPTLNGIIPRPQGGLAAYSGRLRDYCVADDIVCQATLEVSETEHLSYFDNGMQKAGADFVIALMAADSLTN